MTDDEVMAAKSVAVGDRATLLTILADCAQSGDPEIAHIEADKALLKYIGDEEISRAFYAIKMWYA